MRVERFGQFAKAFDLGDFADRVPEVHPKSA